MNIYVYTTFQQNSTIWSKYKDDKHTFFLKKISDYCLNLDLVNPHKSYQNPSIVSEDKKENNNFYVINNSLEN